MPTLDRAWDDRAPAFVASDQPMPSFLRQQVERSRAKRLELFSGNGEPLRATNSVPAGTRPARTDPLETPREKNVQYVAPLIGEDSDQFFPPDASKPLNDMDPAGRIDASKRLALKWHTVAQLALEAARAPDSVSQLRRLREFLCLSYEAVEAAKRRLLQIQESQVGQRTSRASYLKALSEVIGPDPRPPGWHANEASWRASWLVDWKRMYAEYKQMADGGATPEDGWEPEKGWEAVEAAQAAKFAESIQTRVDSGWSVGEAEAYTWLSSIEARVPMARALRETTEDARARYAAATYALCSAMARRPPVDDSQGEPVAFRNLHGKGGLVEGDPAWESIEKADRYGFRGLTSTALVRPTREPRYFDERGFCYQEYVQASSCRASSVAALPPSLDSPRTPAARRAGVSGFGFGAEADDAMAYINVFIPSDVVGFVCAPPDEHGFHGGLNVSTNSIAFPPHTLFRLKEVREPGTWVAPGGARPQQRLLVVTCTFRLPDVDAEGAQLPRRICDPPTTLEYGARSMYVKGLSDVLDRPILSLTEEWTRDMRWRDHSGQECSLAAEWAYVNAPVPNEPPEAVGIFGFGVRDEGNAGKTPEDFRAQVNAHIVKQRATYPACCAGMPEAEAMLTLQEVLAIRLYTGPGYQPMNEFLRQLGKLSGNVRKGVASHTGLTFTATTALLCQAIRKLTAVTSPDDVEQPLYRAVRGELPPSFWVKDKIGMVCAVDAGFMSTSKNRAAPLHYMGGESNNVLWELHPSRESDGAYHRGASVELLSQFKGEEEVLFPPCTMLVVLDTDVIRASHEPILAPEQIEPQDAKVHQAINRDGQTVRYVAVNVRPFFI